MLSEWAESQSGKFEVLLAERNADDGDAQYDAEHQVGKADPDAAQQNPEDVHDDAQASAGLRSGLDFLAERAEGQQTDFEGLYTERNTDDSNAPDNSRKEPKCRADTAEGEEPQNISDKFHLSYSVQYFTRFLYSTIITQSMYGCQPKNEKYLIKKCSVTIVVRLKKKNNRKSDWILLE